jgi:glycosyltransferase 2 family protein
MSRKWFIFLVLCVIAAIVAYRSAGWKFDWALFFSTIRNIHWGWLTASVAVTIFTLYLRAVRWQELLSPVKRIDIGPLFTTTVMGFSSIFLLGRAGELVRPLWLARREKISVSASFATIIVERFLDSTMLVGLFGWALVSVKVSSESAGALALMKHAAWYIVVVSAGAIVLLFLLRSNVELVVRYIPFRKLASLVENFGHGLAFLQNGRSFARVVFHSVALWIMIAIQAWLTLKGLHFNMPLAATTLVMVGAAIGSVAQIPGIGGGFQVAFALCMTKFFQVAPEAALSAAMIGYLTNNLPTLATTIPCMLKDGLTIKEIRNTIRSPQSETT